MSTQYHISPTKGPGPCYAPPGACPFGADAPHFSELSQAQEAFAVQMKTEFGSVPRRNAWNNQDNYGVSSQSQTKAAVVADAINELHETFAEGSPGYYDSCDDDMLEQSVQSREGYLAMADAIASRERYSARALNTLSRLDQAINSSSEGWLAGSYNREVMNQSLRELSAHDDQTSRMVVAASSSPYFPTLPKLDQGVVGNALRINGDDISPRDRYFPGSLTWNSSGDFMSSKDASNIALIGIDVSDSEGVDRMLGFRRMNHTRPDTVFNTTKRAYVSRALGNYFKRHSHSYITHSLGENDVLTSIDGNLVSSGVNAVSLDDDGSVISVTKAHFTNKGRGEENLLEEYRIEALFDAHVSGARHADVIMIETCGREREFRVYADETFIPHGEKTPVAMKEFIARNKQKLDRANSNRF